MRRDTCDKKGSWQPASSDRVYSIHFVDGLATYENPIPTVSLVMKVTRKNQEERYLERYWKKVREGDITPATSTSQEDEVPMLANFLDENLDINMEELNEPMEVIYEPMKTIPGDHTYCIRNNSTPCYACQDKSIFVKALVSKISKLTLENKQLKYRSIMKTSAFTWRKDEV